MRACATIALSLLLPIAAALASGEDAESKAAAPAKAAAAAAAPAKAKAPAKPKAPAKDKDKDKAEATKDRPFAHRELAKPAADVEFDAVAFGDALEVLRGLCAANVFVDPKGLEAAGVELDAPVTVPKDKKATVKSVLSKVLAEAGKADRKARLTFVPTGNIVIVSTAGRAKLLSDRLRADVHSALSEADRAVLGRVLPEIKLDGVQLADALGLIGDVTATPVEPNWEQLEASGVTRDEIVDLHLRDVTVAEVLRLVLEAAAPTEMVAFVAHKGRTRVSSARGLLTTLEGESDELDAEATRKRRR